MKKIMVSIFVIFLTTSMATPVLHANSSMLKLHKCRRSSLFVKKEKQSIGVMQRTDKARAIEKKKINSLKVIKQRR